MRTRVDGLAVATCGGDTMAPGRNAPCPCGSGRKLKHCCADKLSPGVTGRPAVSLPGRPIDAARRQDAKKQFQLGNAQAAQGRMSQAVIHYEQALSVLPDYVEAASNLGNALVALELYDQAIPRFEQALLVRPDAQVHFNLAIVYERLGQVGSAIVHHEHALALRPDYAEAMNNLGTLTRHSRGLMQAIAHFERALELKPDLYEAHNNLGLALQDRGDITQAIRHFDRALALRPDFVAAHSNKLFALNYAADLTPETVFEAHREFGVRWGEFGSSAGKKGECARVLPLTGKLRIGYVSSDFRQHSVAHFIEPVLAHHDHARFDIVCYANALEEDAVTARLKDMADVWRPIARLGDEQAAQLIQCDEIDILVDLTGHTMNNRLLMFARRPSPVQVTWVGYPNTTGLDAMDYRITDALADPVGMTEQLHTETLVRLPDCFSVYQPPVDAPAVSVLPALARGQVTFGSFNKLAKITPEVVAVWASILRAVPGSRLVLKTGAFVETAMRQRVAEQFSRLGVDPQRLGLRGHDATQGAHLEQYAEVDIALDPFPYNGTTTTCEALWMGVPVVTLVGLTHVSRVGLSQVSSLGQGDLACRTPEAYIARAAQLAENIDTLAVLRATLRQRMALSPLMDAPRFTRNLEDAFVWMQTQQSARSGETTI